MIGQVRRYADDTYYKGECMKRRTRDYWELQGNYGFGWECLAADSSIGLVRANLRDYRDNEHGNYRIVRKREPIQQGETT